MGIVHGAVYTFQTFGPLELNFTNAIIAAGLIVGMIGSIWGPKWLLKKWWKDP